MLGFPKPSNIIEILSPLPLSECVERLQEQISSSDALPEWPLVGKVTSRKLRIYKQRPVTLFSYDPYWMEFYAELAESPAGTKIIGQFRINRSTKAALIILPVFSIVLGILAKSVGFACICAVWFVGTFYFFSYCKNRANQSPDDQSYVIDYIRKIVETPLSGAIDPETSSA